MPWADMILKATVVIGAALLAARACRCGSAALRHSILIAGLAAALAVPLLSPALPKLDLELPAAVWAEPRTSGEAVGPEPALHAAHVIETAPSAPTGPAEPVVVATPDRIAAGFAATHATPSGIPVSAGNWERNAPAAAAGALLPVLWLAGVLFSIARLLSGRWKLHALLARSSTVADAGWSSLIAELAVAAGSPERMLRAAGIRRARLLRSSETDVPLAAGLFRPAVVLPADANEWTALRRVTVLRHELAHIRRHDALTEMVTELATALYWFHPLVWLAAGASRLERERACDDSVLAAGVKPSDYAGELMGWIPVLDEGPRCRVALGMARRSQLERRMVAVLRPDINRRSLSRTAAAGVVLATLCLTLPLAAMKLRGAGRQSAGNRERNAPAVAAGREGPATPPARENRTLEAGDAKSLSLFTARPAPEAPPATTAHPAPEAPPATTAHPTQAPPATTARPAQAPPATTAHPAPEAATNLAMLRPLAAVALLASAPRVAAGPQAFPAALDCPPGGRFRNNSFSSHGDRGGRRTMVASWSGDGCSVEIRAEGDIKLNRLATDIESISPGGYFEVNHRAGATLRRLFVSPGPDGKPGHQVSFDGQSQALNRGTRDWIASVITAFERRTGYAVETRVPALVEQGGAGAVLDEISRLGSDYVRARYFLKLLASTRLGDPLLRRAIEQSGREISSDYELARVLIAVSGGYDLADEASRQAFSAAAGTLESDYERARVLIELVKRDRLSRETLQMTIRALARMKSDYERARVLITLAGKPLLDEAVQAAYIEATAAMHSDYERARSLMALIGRSPLGGATLRKLFETSAGMRSDYELARVLVMAAKTFRLEGDARAAYIRAAEGIRSQYERNRALAAVVASSV